MAHRGVPHGASARDRGARRRPAYPRRAMRALVVTNMYPTAERPALGSFVRDQVEALRRRDDVEIELFAFPPGLRAYPEAARELRRRYRGERFDVVHAHFGLTAWPAVAARLGPVVVTLHGNDLFHPRSNRLTRAILPFTALPAAVSREFSGLLRGAGTTRRVAVLPVGIDLDRFRPIPRPGPRAARPRSRRALPALPARSVAAAQALRSRAGGGGRDHAADDGQRRAGGRAVLDQRVQRRARAVAGRGVRTLGDRGARLRRAGVRDAGRDPPGRARGHRGRVLRTVGSRGVESGAAAGAGGGRSARRRAATGRRSSRPTGWLRGWSRRGATWRCSAPLGESPGCVSAWPSDDDPILDGPGRTPIVRPCQYERPAATPDTPRPCDRRREPVPDGRVVRDGRRACRRPCRAGRDRPVPATSNDAALPATGRAAARGLTRRPLGDRGR